MTLPFWTVQSVFMGLMLAASVFMVVIAGHFPAATRSKAFRTPIGFMLLWSSIAVLALSALGAIYFAYILIPWYAAIIGAGFMILVAPALVQRLADWFVDGQSVLILLAFIVLILDVAAVKLLS